MVRVSIKDIAQSLGVSSATVSLVLNGKEKKGRVSKVMSDKIREKAKEMNYKPNSLARGLRMGKSNTIGLIVADISNMFFAKLAFHIQEYAESLDYTVIIANTNESDAKMSNMINVLRGRQVDGLIVVPTEKGLESITEVVESRLPLVLLDRTFPSLQVNHVTIDNRRASREAVQYLIDKGCRNISLFVYKSELYHMEERKKGYIEALQDNGLFRSGLIKEVRYEYLQEDVKSGIEELFGVGRKVDGILFATNSISMVGLKELFDINVNVPKDIKVVSFDKNDAFDFLQSKIPYMVQPISEMGRAATDMLIEQIERENAAPRKLELFARLANT